MPIQTHVTWGRDWTAEEVELNTNKIAELANDGVVIHWPNPIDGVIIREWDTVEQANNWLAFVNSFTPPPVSASIVTE